MIVADGAAVVKSSSVNVLRSGCMWSSLVNLMLFYVKFLTRELKRLVNALLKFNMPTQALRPPAAFATPYGENRGAAWLAKRAMPCFTFDMDPHK